MAYPGVMTELENVVGLPSAEAQVRLILSPQKRRKAVIKMMDSARTSLVLSVFQCDDLGILEAVAAAVRRNVRVKVLLSQRASGWKQRLEDLGRLLESIGAEVYRYLPTVKYHAKYI